MTEARRALRRRAIELRADGLSYGQIAVTLGIPRTTVVRWTNPASAERSRDTSNAWKRRATGTCEKCGATTRYNGQTGTRVSRLCATCGSTLGGAMNAEARRGKGPLQVRTVAFLSTPRTWTELRDHLGIKDQHVGVHVDRLLKQGQIRRVSRGVYVVARGGG